MAWYLFYEEDSPEADRFHYLASYDEEVALNVDGGLERHLEARGKAKKVWTKIKASNRLAKNPELVWTEPLLTR